jgi:heterodisulfide reductase subunit B
MEYTYYPGCSLESTSKAYDESLRKVFELLKLGLHELPDWNCCGATMYMSVDEHLASGLSARNLAIAEQLGRDVVAPCSSCFTILSKTHRLMRDSEEVRRGVDEALAPEGLQYNLGLRIRHPLDVLVNDVGIQLLKLEAKRDLDGLRIANYYGCQIVRPERGFDDRENPTTMDNMFEALGGSIVYFPMKVRCCGGMLMTTYPDVALTLVKELLESAQENGAEVIVTTCPLCQINLEAYQRRINSRFGTRFRIPVLFFTQLLGLALGARPEELGFQRLLVPFRKPLRQLVGDRAEQ